MTGMPVDPGIDFAGGVAVTIPPTTDSQAVVEGYFSEYPLKSVGDGGVNGGYYVVFEYMPDDEFLSLSKVINEHYPDAKVDQIGETFGKTLQAQALWHSSSRLSGWPLWYSLSLKTLYRPSLW